MSSEITYEDIDALVKEHLLINMGTRQEQPAILYENAKKWKICPHDCLKIYLSLMNFDDVEHLSPVIDVIDGPLTNVPLHLNCDITFGGTSSGTIKVSEIAAWRLRIGK